MLKFNFAQHQKMTVELERKCREFIRTHGEVRLRQIIEVNSSYIQCPKIAINLLLFLDQNYIEITETSR